MMILDAKSVATALPYDQLVDALSEAFCQDIIVPARVHHEVSVPGGNAGTLLLMPAWQSGAHMGVKVVSVFPDNADREIPAVSGSYLLMNATTGVPIAFLDGTELTLRRTAAASALASSYLSRKDAGKLLMIGTGNLAPHMIKAHCSVRPIKEVCVWGRRPAAAKALVEEMPALSAKISVADNLEEAVANADVISCATLANEPIVKGDWLVPGQHLDLVGAFTPAMAEADTTAVSRAAVFVDTREGALAEAGEIVQAIQGGSFDASDIRGSLGELCRGTIAGRTASEQITLFKSVGTAIEDLAAAELAMRNHLSSDAQQST